jgi:hypothetical protein
MNQSLKIAVILGAVDQMSGVVNSAFSNAQRQFTRGSAMFSAGLGIGQSMVNFAEDFKTLEDAATKTKISMMTEGGLFDVGKYAEIENFTKDLSEKYGNTTANYLDMVRIMRNNRLNPEDIMGGAGESAAMFGELFNVLPKEAALFAARMKNDMQVSVKDMPAMLDLAARLHGAGVGTTGEETINDLTEFFSKAGLGAVNLGVTGLDDAKKLGALGGLFVTKGVSAASVGTNFRRIFDGLRDAERIGKVGATANQYGVSLEFFKDGKFAGIDNFQKQLTKLQGLDPQQIDAVLKPFSGKQGLSTDFLDYLVKFGDTDISEFNKRINEQADIHDKVSLSLQTLTLYQLRSERSWENTRAALAEGYTPAMKEAYEISMKFAEVVQDFAEQNPTIIKWGAGIIAGGAALLTLAGGIKAVGAVWGMIKVIEFSAVADGFILMAGAIRTFGIAIGTYLPEITALAIIVAGIYEAYKYFSEMHQEAFKMNEGQTPIDNPYFGPISVAEIKKGNTGIVKPNNGLNQTLTYAPTVIVQGTADAEKMKQLLQSDKNEFWRKYQDMENQKRRTSIK